MRVRVCGYIYIYIRNAFESLVKSLRWAAGWLASEEWVGFIPTIYSRCVKTVKEAHATSHAKFDKWMTACVHKLWPMVPIMQTSWHTERELAPWAAALKPDCIMMPLTRFPFIEYQTLIIDPRYHHGHSNQRRCLYLRLVGHNYSISTSELEKISPN